MIGLSTPATPDQAPHIPVLLDPLMRAIAPVRGVWLDGTFGAGGYSRALLDASARRVIAIDRDPDVFRRAEQWAQSYGERLIMVAGEFGQLDLLAEAQGLRPLDGVVLDIGVSSMQIDEAARGFSFQKDGPLDMRMSQAGPSAADLVNGAGERQLAEILIRFGEERAGRRIARAIVKARDVQPITTTARLAEIVSRCLPPQKKGQIHPATRSFQAIRIVVNDELGQLVEGLAAAERALGPGGLLAVVTFHSIEDRIVKRYMASAEGAGGRANRFAPEVALEVPRFERLNRKAITAEESELAANPRSRTAKLRIARRLDAPARAADPVDLGMPDVDLEGAFA